MRTSNPVSDDALVIPAGLGIVSRAALSAIFVLGGRGVWSNPTGPAHAVADFLATTRQYCPPLSRVSDEQLVRVNAAVMIAGGLALGSSLAPRPGAALLLGSLVPTTVAGFPYWKMPPGPERIHAQSDFLKNLAVAGGLVSSLAYSLLSRRRRCHQ